MTFNIYFPDISEIFFLLFGENTDKPLQHLTLAPTLKPQVLHVLPLEKKQLLSGHIVAGEELFSGPEKWNSKPKVSKTDISFMYYYGCTHPIIPHFDA